MSRHRGMNHRKASLSRQPLQPARTPFAIDSWSPFSTAGWNYRGWATTDDFKLLEPFVISSFGVKFRSQTISPNWPTTRLTFEESTCLCRSAECFTRWYLRSTNVSFNLELPFHTVNKRYPVQPSPIPEITVSHPVFRVCFNAECVGSSSILYEGHTHLVLVRFRFSSSTINWITGSELRLIQGWFLLFSFVNESPVVVSFKTNGSSDISRVNCLISLRVLACIWRIRPIRSRLPLEVFNTCMNLESTWVNTDIVKRPTRSVIMIFEGKSVKWLFIRCRTFFFLHLYLLTPLDLGIIGGLRQSRTASNINWTLLFLKAEPQSTG